MSGRRYRAPDATITVRERMRRSPGRTNAIGTPGLRSVGQSRPTTSIGTATSAPNLSAWLKARPARAWPEISRWKSQVVLSCSICRPVPHRPLVEDDHRQSLGRRIHRSSQACGTGTDDCDVVDGGRIEDRRHSEAGCDIGIRRLLQDRAIGADDQRQVAREHPGPFDQGAPFLVGRCVERQILESCCA